MSNLLEAKQQKQNHCLLQSFNEKESTQKNRLENITKLELNKSFNSFKRNLTLNHSTLESPERNKEKYTISEKKISYIFSSPKQERDLSFSCQYTKYRDLINISEKRLIDSIKKMPLGDQSQKQSPKIKNFQIPITAISQTLDLTKLNNLHEKTSKTFSSFKMPDLIKIKLKKELQTIQKNQKSKKPHLMRNYNKTHLKKQSKSIVFLDQHFDKFQEEKQREKSKQRSKRKIINQRKFSNFKKYEKAESTQKPYFTLIQNKQMIEMKQRLKRTITEEADYNQISNQRKQAKYSHLLEYVKKPAIDPLHQDKKKVKNRIKTQSALYSSLIAADVNILQLEGTKIKEGVLLTHQQAEINLLFGRLKHKFEKTTPSDSRKRLSLSQKSSAPDVQKISGERLISVKGHQIGPWNSFSQQGEHGFD